MKKGDTLASIAQKNGLKWQQITTYNFGTATPSEVNDCLHEYVGCTERTIELPAAAIGPREREAHREVVEGRNHGYLVLHTSRLRIKRGRAAALLIAGSHACCPERAR